MGDIRWCLLVLCYCLAAVSFTWKCLQRFPVKGGLNQNQMWHMIWNDTNLFPQQTIVLVVSINHDKESEQCIKSPSVHPCGYLNLLVKFSSSLIKSVLLTQAFVLQLKWHVQLDKWTVRWTIMVAVCCWKYNLIEIRKYITGRVRLTFPGVDLRGERTSKHFEQHSSHNDKNDFKF